MIDLAGLRVGCGKAKANGYRDIDIDIDNEDTNSSRCAAFAPSEIPWIIPDNFFAHSDL
jgi:hypothetical protein